MNDSVVSDQMYESYYDDVARRLEVQFADSDYSEIDFGYTIRLLNPRNVGGTFGVFDADGKMTQMGLKVSRNTRYVINDAAEEMPIPTVSYEVVEPVATGWNYFIAIFLIGGVISMGGLLWCRRFDATRREKR